MGARDVTKEIAAAFEKELRNVGWQRSRTYFTKDMDRIVKEDGVYVYNGMKLRIEPDGNAIPNYDDVRLPLPYEMEILGCMQKAEEMIRNG